MSKRISRPGRLAMLLLVASLAGACSLGEPGEGGDGLGGTGVYSLEGGDGIGGTGIVGTLARLDRLEVNGLEIGLDESTRIELDGRPAGPAALAPGQVVEVLASGPLQALQAQRIEVRHALAGPLQQQRPGLLRVAGVDVRLQAGTRFAARLGPEPGQWLQISGYWDPGGQLHATRIEPGRPGRWIFSGVARESGAGWQLAGRALAPDPALAGQLSGRRLWLSTGSAPDRLTVSAADLRPPRPFEGRVARLVVRGFPDLQAAAGPRLHGWDLPLSAPRPGDRWDAADTVLMDVLSLDRDTTRLLGVDAVRPSSLDRPVLDVPTDQRPPAPDADLRPPPPARPVRPEPVPAPDVRSAPIRDLEPVPITDVDSRESLR